MPRPPPRPMSINTSSSTSTDGSMPSSTTDVVSDWEGLSNSSEALSVDQRIDRTTVSSPLAYTETKLLDSQLSLEYAQAIASDKHLSRNAHFDAPSSVNFYVNEIALRHYEALKNTDAAEASVFWSEHITRSVSERIRWALHYEVEYRFNPASRSLKEMINYLAVSKRLESYGEQDHCDCHKRHGHVICLPDCPAFA